MTNVSKRATLLALSMILLASGLFAQTSVPVVPAQPDKQFYGLYDLMLFKTYDRATYKKTFGVDAPNYDPSKRIKTWFDSTQSCDDPDAVAIYKTVGSDKAGNPAMKQVLLPACEAATVNLIGRNEYGTYVVQPTKAVVRSAPIDGVQLPDAPLNPDYLSLKIQAEQLRAELGASDPVNEASLSGPFGYFYPADEPRRMWQIGANNVGLLLKHKFSFGVGRPGKWERTASDYVWTPDPLPPDGMTDSRPTVPTPMRDLQPNEALRANPFGTQVERLDKKNVADKEQGKFLDEDRQMLRQILELLKQR